MLYCPKCQKTYDEGAARFCLNDSARLLPAPSSGKSINQKGGVFANILEKVSSAGSNDGIFSFESKFFKKEPDQTEPSKLTEFESSTAVKKELEFNQVLETQPQKPLPRMIKPGEIPVSQAKLGDRKINPTGRMALTWENPDVLLGQMVKGRYQITENLGHDEASISYLAEDKIVPDKKVVVRVLMNEDEYDHFTNKIFAEERVSLSLIIHPNIARILDSGELLEGKPFIISEFTKGSSVMEILLEAGKFNALRTARIIRQTADALSEAHRNGVLHRNLKPENIILTVSDANSEQVKLTDFGISKGSLNRENLIYKSPEQIEGKLANYASDIYSLAAIAYQMLTNRLPFDGSNAGELLKSQRAGLRFRPTNLRLDLPPSVDEILEKALNLNPSERFPKARDFGDALFNSLTTIPNWEKEISAEVEKIDIFAVNKTSGDESSFDTAFADFELNENNPLTDNPANFQTLESVEEIKPANKEEIAKNEDLPWERRSPEPPKNAGLGVLILSLIGLALLIAGVWGSWSYFLNRRNEIPTAQTPVESLAPIDNVIPPDNAKLNVPTPAEVESPPVPRLMTQPPDTDYFQNTKDQLKGDMAKNFLGFSLYYPKDWQKNDAKGKFLDISKNASSGTMMEQMLVSYYNSKGTYKADTELFPSLIKETNSTLKELVPNYEMVSEGEKTVNNGWRAYEVKFKGSGKSTAGENITLWGKRLYIPTARPGMKNGYVITMLATSLSPEIKNVDEVGVKGDLSGVLETFEPNQVF